METTNTESNMESVTNTNNTPAKTKRAKREESAKPTKKNPKPKTDPKPAPKPDAAEAPKPVKEARDRRADALEAEGDTLAKMCSGWLEHLESVGKTASTIASYSIDLAIAQDVIGPKTKPSSINAKRVAEFWNHPRVTQRRDGSPKNPITTAKIRRAFRLALTWAIDAAKFGLDDSKDARKLFPSRDDRDADAAAAVEGA